MSFSALIQLLSLALQAYIVSVKAGQNNEIDTLEDEMYRCIDDGTAAAKLRLKRLKARRQRKLQLISPLRSADDSSDQRDDLPV